MSESSQTTVVGANTSTSGSTPSAAQTDTRPEKTISIIARDSVKDTGRVHVGGGMMRF
jgi:hypothetical protein